MKEINVIVTGNAGSGKSTVARLIELALTHTYIGAEVKRIDDNGTGGPDEKPGEIEATVAKRWDSLISKGLKITVRTALVNRKAAKID
jgi:broad-specificity NMP kinase